MAMGRWGDDDADDDSGDAGVGADAPQQRFIAGPITASPMNPS